MARISPRTICPYYLKAFVRQTVFAQELLRFSVGTVQRGIYLESLAKLAVPILDAGQMQLISEFEMRSDMQFKAALELVSAATILIERLIEGTVTEGELVAARDDSTADRALMHRITRSGTQGEEPLIRSLDDLSGLIADSADRFTPAV
jgi:hypothetical protein